MDSNGMSTRLESLYAKTLANRIHLYVVNIPKETKNLQLSTFQWNPNNLHV